MKVFISGPMTGRPEGNFAEFDAAVRLVRHVGHTPVNPHDIKPERDTRWTDAEYYEVCMRADLAVLKECDAILMLRGWKESRGATREYAQAVEDGLHVIAEGMLYY